MCPSELNKDEQEFILECQKYNTDRQYMGILEDFVLIQTPA